MGLFSSKSSSSTTQYTQTQQTSASFGDLAHDNLSSGGDLSIYQEGLSHDNLQLVLGATSSATDSAIKSAQSLAGQAIETTGKAYADAYSGSQNESSRFFDALRPFAVIAGIVAIFYLWGKK